VVSDQVIFLSVAPFNVNPPPSAEVSEGPTALKVAVPVEPDTLLERTIVLFVIEMI
jgi:hypothetical protein